MNDMATQTQQVAFRLSVDLVKRIDAYVARMKTREPGLEVTRADAVRVLLTKALDAEGGSKAKK